MSEPLIMRRARQREQLILALLQQPGMEKAAASIGISGVTAWRITKTPEFQEEYRLARREAFTQSLGRLQQAAGAAAATLLKVMLDATAPPASRVRAADCVLEHAANALDLEDIQVRLAKLEQIEKDREKENKEAELEQVA
jgi:hypothetical protein